MDDRLLCAVLTMNKTRNVYAHEILQNQIFKHMCIYFYHSEAKLYYILFIKLFPYMFSIFSPHPVILFPLVISNISKEEEARSRTTCVD